MRVAALVATPNPIQLGQTTEFAVLVDGYEGDGPIEVCISVAYPASLGVHTMLCQTVSAAAPAIVTFRSQVRSNTPAKQIDFDVLVGNGSVNASFRDTLSIAGGGEPVC